MITLPVLRQRGVMTVTTPLLVLLLFFLTVILLDGARLYAKKRAMQAEATAAVTAAADLIQACSLTTPNLGVITQVAQSAARDQGWDGQEQLNIFVGVVEAGPDNVAEFRPVSRVQESNAVAVEYIRNEPVSALLPQRYFGSVQLRVTAAAKKEVVATLSASPSTAVVDGALLGSLLGVVLNDSNFRLDATSMASLMNTTVRLGDLLQTLGVGSVTDLLGLGAGELAGALRTVSGATGPLARALDGIIASAGINTIQVADIIDVVGQFGAPENSTFPLYDAVISMTLNVLKLRQDQTGALITLPLVISDLNIPLVAEIRGLALRIHIGRPPVIVIGPARQGPDGQWLTQFYAPDISIELNAEVRLVNIDLLDLATLNLAQLNIPLGVHVGGGAGFLVGAECAAGVAQNSVLLDVMLETNVARIVSGTINPSTGAVSYQPIDARVGTLRLLFGLIPVLDPALRVRAGLDASVPSESRVVELAPALRLDCLEAPCQPASYQSPGGGLSGLNLTVNPLQVDLLGIGLGQLLTPVTALLRNVLNSVVASLASAVINPLLQLLGLGLSGISVEATSAVQAPLQILEGIEIVQN